MKKKIIALAIAASTLAVAAIGGTMAYFTDTDSAENVMTIGKIDIVQNEYEWGADGLIEFTQDKPLFPYVGNLAWADPDTYGNDENYRRFAMDNVIDKYVTVTNTGKNDAYVRTFIALEMGDGYNIDEAPFIGVSFNNANTNAWVWEKDFVIEINGCTYAVMSAVHTRAIAPDEETIPSLLQVYLDKEATQEDADVIDQNDDGLYTVYALTQAVQVNGFEEEGAELALDEAFGDVTTANLEAWFAAEFGA